ncbi:hypothetical protein ACJ73_03565 [Blastomyces percursus]|uniref:Uncharacterized protein n=1 Tax=Blastomyces percursus TaxID=1658174 RepID=A0A1J9Q961_9EURO|nr:hypothetical protein ACJ73_03565 [Blastomyces percursus]
MNEINQPSWEELITSQLLGDDTSLLMTDQFPSDDGPILTSDLLDGSDSFWDTAADQLLWAASAPPPSPCEETQECEKTQCEDGPHDTSVLEQKIRDLQRQMDALNWKFTQLEEKSAQMKRSVTSENGI